jgi:hypothetical protein
MKSAIMALAIHMMRIFFLSSSFWFVIDPSFREEVSLKLGIAPAGRQQRSHESYGWPGTRGSAFQVLF